MKQFVSYLNDKIAEVKRLILMHDNWAIGDDFRNEPILRIFNNFDFMWMASEKGFDIVRSFVNMPPTEFYKQIEKFQKENEEQGRGWFSKDIEAFYQFLDLHFRKRLTSCSIRRLDIPNHRPPESTPFRRASYR